MKTKLILIACSLLILAGSASAQASPEDALKSFYKWYLHSVVANDPPTRTSAKVSAASSTRLRTWFRSSTGREWDADYFIDAQDYDDDWATNIAVSKARLNGSRADLIVTLGPKKSPEHAIGQRELKVKMVKEAGGWKIDRVNGH
ncbi:MAG TPA: DUF3828 domain-containing protein [Pyrinomonadaceae bacterium]|jgi:hypothetical protein